MLCKFLYTISLTKDMYGNQKLMAMFEAEDGTRLIWKTIETSKALLSMTVGKSYKLKWTEVDKLSDKDYLVERVHIIK